MHRLLAIGLVGTGLAIFGLACPATAMKPASNADLHRCLGMGVTEDNMICVKGGECAGAPPAGVIASCTGDNETSHCYIPGSLSGPAGDN